MSIDEADLAKQRSRRAILAGAIGGLAGLVGSRIAWPEEAEAAAGHAMLLGRSNSAGTKNTSLTTKTTGHALKVTQKGTGTALRGSNTLGTGVSGVTANNAKFGVDAANTAAANGTGAAMRATGGANTGLTATSNGIAINATGGSVGIVGTGAAYGGYMTGSGSSSIGAIGVGSLYGVYGSSTQYGSVSFGSTVGAYVSGPTGVQANGTNFGVLGTASSNAGVAVRGSGGQYGVHGMNGGTAGVRGDSGYVGAWGQATTYGVYGFASGSGQTYGVYGQSSNSSAFAIFAQGNAHVNGTLTKTAGAFKIDHPLDPENRWLSHSFVESPDMLNVYSGNAQLDGSGKATIKLPTYFGALNRAVRYQLTAIGAPAPSLHVSKEISKNTFAVAGGAPGQTVSWQVTGIRQDDYAKAHPIEVETAKAGSERGTRQFVPKGSKARLMTVGPAAPRDKQPAMPTAIPDKVSPISH